eukprot:CAMPEP_0181230002 /NCGR_PEP_ID=MMETSP1096-20121128/34218_1 /TAXON_ID=156174 ORGANISM="Chrysochromulina ericina, Strain CCMP281" /NCGR_SAMPLE_ID=MMETSP1096 /ASSEMBLY_ACC=CAM_ASM_000453 /LENGTH=115 /DNA_ID=CAMNT_0023323703 /DNA_START=150 /DNA_END=498 /DNA_ORIENTATION=+
MYFDDRAFWVQKEDLVPFFREHSAIVTVWHAFVFKVPLERLYVIRAEGNVAFLNGVDDAAVAEGNTQVALCQMHLHRAVCGEGDLAGEPAPSVVLPAAVLGNISAGISSIRITSR